jgi:hypothetical protein
VFETARFSSRIPVAHFSAGAIATALDGTIWSVDARASRVAHLDGSGRVLKTQTLGTVAP